MRVRTKVRPTTYQDDGTYDVVLTVTNDCGDSETLQTITIPQPRRLQVFLLLTLLAVNLSR